MEMIALVPLVVIGLGVIWACVWPSDDDWPDMGEVGLWR
jgi:hypothetical protein